MMYLTSRLPVVASASLRSVSRVARPAALRTLTTSVARLDEQSPVFQGRGAAPGEMPTDENQSTGLERFELYGRMEGVDVFEMDPLPADRLGTVKDPVKYHEKIIGCTGVPAETHETLWLNMNLDKEFTRCPRCGSVYQLDFIGESVHHHH